MERSEHRPGHVDGPADRVLVCLSDIEERAPVELVVAHLHCGRDDDLKRVDLIETEVLRPEAADLVGLVVVDGARVVPEDDLPAAAPATQHLHGVAVAVDDRRPSLVAGLSAPDERLELLPRQGAEVETELVRSGDRPTREGVDDRLGVPSDGALERDLTTSLPVGRAAGEGLVQVVDVLHGEGHVDALAVRVGYDPGVVGEGRHPGCGDHTQVTVDELLQLEVQTAVSGELREQLVEGHLVGRLLLHVGDLDHLRLTGALGVAAELAEQFVQLHRDAQALAVVVAVRVGEHREQHLAQLERGHVAELVERLFAELGVELAEHLVGEDGALGQHRDELAEGGVNLVLGHSGSLSVNVLYTRTFRGKGQAVLDLSVCSGRTYILYNF